VVGPPERQRSAERTSRLTGWLAFAGAIVAACLGGVFTIVAAFIQDGDDRPAPPAQAPRDGAVPATGPPAGATTAGPPDAGAGQPVVRVRDGIVLRASAVEVDSIVLDADPLQKGTDFQFGDLHVWSIDAGGEARIRVPGLSESAVARWEADGTPSFRQCRDVSLRQGVDDLHVATGERLCVKTRKGRTAMMLIRSVNRSTGTVSAEVTVWEPLGGS
jgi:hypothetical protein